MRWSKNSVSKSIIFNNSSTLFKISLSLPLLLDLLISESILYRANSWSRMKITVQMFKALCTFDQITPHFLKIVFGFGRKLSSSDESYMTCYCKLSTKANGETSEGKNNEERHSGREKEGELQLKSFG